MIQLQGNKGMQTWNWGGVFCYFKSPPPSSWWPAAAPSWLCAGVTAYIIFLGLTPLAMCGYYLLAITCARCCSLWLYYLLAVICAEMCHKTGKHPENERLLLERDLVGNNNNQTVIKRKVKKLLSACFSSAPGWKCSPKKKWWRLSPITNTDLLL